LINFFKKFINLSTPKEIKCNYCGKIINSSIGFTNIDCCQKCSKEDLSQLQSKEKEWWIILPGRGQRKQGPYTISELLEFSKDIPTEVNPGEINYISVRRGKKSEWVRMGGKDFYPKNLFNLDCRTEKECQCNHNVDLSEKKDIIICTECNLKLRVPTLEKEILVSCPCGNKIICLSGKIKPQKSTSTKPPPVSDRNNVDFKTDERLENLVNRLIFYQHEPTFLNALREATAMAPKGDDLGVRALSEAIRRRSGKKDIVFYAPSFGGLTTRQSKEILEAESKLLELAKSGILIKDPAKTQNLISAALCASGDDLNSFVKDIFMVAGAEQGYDFQLLFNQINSSIKLKYAHGERSWTQKMMNEENEKYFEVPVQVTSFRCSDRECLCAGTDELIPGKTGYLLITEEIIQLRKDALKWEELTTKLRKVQANTDSIISFHSFHVNPIFMCKESALNHGINLEIAASDAKRWADSGLCPLRATPINTSLKEKEWTPEIINVTSSETPYEIPANKIGLSVLIANEGKSALLLNELQLAAFELQKKLEPELFDSMSHHNIKIFLVENAEDPQSLYFVFDLLKLASPYSAYVRTPIVALREGEPRQTIYLVWVYKDSSEKIIFSDFQAKFSEKSL